MGGGGGGEGREGGRRGVGWGEAEGAMPKGTEGVLRGGGRGGRILCVVVNAPPSHAGGWGCGVVGGGEGREGERGGVGWGEAEGAMPKGREGVLRGGGRGGRILCVVGNAPPSHAGGWVVVGGGRRAGRGARGCRAGGRPKGRCRRGEKGC